MHRFDSESEHPKKRRRREAVPRPFHARIILDDSLKGELAILSESLSTKLGIVTQEDVENDVLPHVAISPASPLHVNVQDSIWTILPIKTSNPSASGGITDTGDFVKISSKSTSCQSFLKTLASIDATRHGSYPSKTIEIRVVAADPLALNTIYVSVERGILEKVDEIQSRFGGGFHNHSKGKKPTLRDQYIAAAKDDTSLDERLAAVVRDGLSNLRVIHAGDIFPLPLPAHPITHARPAPAIVLECEPVAQGYVSARTKVIIVQAGSSQEKTLKKLTPVSIIEESLEDTAEDTSNDQFFSAAEDKLNGTVSEIDGTSEEDTANEDSDMDHSDDDSDSMDDLISLSAPGLPPQPAGTLSAMTAATPRPGGIRASGTHTPGSVYSNFTAATARAGGNRPGKVFRTEALLRHVPVELLHPRPGPEDDEEATILVDTSTLAKIGCFSGDWVRIEVARNVSSFGFPLGFSGINGPFDEEESEWRVVRVYGLPGLLNQKPRYMVDKTGERRSSFSQPQSFNPLTPVLYLSPVLLANLSNAKFVKVGALPKPPRTHGRHAPLQSTLLHKSPPFAREVTLLMVSTPITTDKQLQPALFSQLKAHFESKKRVLKKGDLLAIPIDEELGKATAAATTAEPGVNEDELTVKLQKQGRSNHPRSGTAWFSVQRIDADKPSEAEENSEFNSWGDVAIVDSLNVRLSQAGNTVQSIPETIELWTKYWLGLKSLPSRPSRAYDPVTTIADMPDLQKLPLEKRIADLVTASTSPRAISLGLPPLVILLHSAQRQIGKSYIANSACGSVGLHTFPISCHDLLSENASTSGGGDVKTDALLQVRADRALSCGAQQTAILLQHIDTLTADRIVPTLKSVISSSRVLFATTTKIDDIPDGIRSLFTHEFEVGAPNEEARELILRNASLSTSIPLSPNINLKNLALQTAALVAGDLLDVVNRAVLARSNRLSALADSQDRSLNDIIISGGQSVSHLTPLDFSTAISAARSTFSDAIGAPKIPTVTWQDVGGLSSQKDAIMETISLPLTRPELFANGIRKRSGILFYGPPGTGKTLLAKAIATEFSLNFFSVKGPELLNMYIGESEANVRRVFQKARDARPCVVFFDELDSVAPKRGNQGDSGGVMDRIVSQLLAELDGMSGGGSKDGTDEGQSNGGGGVFVIGATNRPDLLDPALLRPGRFDKMLYLGVADSHDSQVTIMEALTRKFTLDSSVDLRRVANKLPFTYTGADLYALCSDAMLKAITRKTQSVDQKVKDLSEERGEEISTGWFFDHLATEEDVQVIVNEDDFIAAQRELVGSVSAKELEHFERIRLLFEENDISAGSQKPSLGPNTSRAPARITPVVSNSLDGTDNSTIPFRTDKGKQRETSISRGKMIANPDSGLESEEGDFSNDYGVSAATASTASYANGSIHMQTNGTGSLKGKGKARADGFQEEVGLDEDLYD